MAQFSEQDINEAKRRVRELQSRAAGFVFDKENNVPTDDGNEAHTHSDDKNEEVKPEKGESSDDKSEDKSFFIILALILLLSREGADNTLILALLYLLL